MAALARGSMPAALSIRLRIKGRAFFEFTGRRLDDSAPRGNAPAGDPGEAWPIHASVVTIVVAVGRNGSSRVDEDPLPFDPKAPRTMAPSRVNPFCLRVFQQVKPPIDRPFKMATFRRNFDTDRATEYSNFLRDPNSFQTFLKLTNHVGIG